MALLLAGDVGATKTDLGLFVPGGDRPRPVLVREFATLAFPSLGDMVETFLRGAGHSAAEVDVAAFGVAGPVTGPVARMTHVPWSVDTEALDERFGFGRVLLVNDLEAMAYAVPVLEPSELDVLQEGVAQASGNAAVIAAGTGLGEALLHNVEGRFVPSPCEGGHADFAARTPRELALVEWLLQQYGRAQVEHVVSGPGLANLYRFTHATPCERVGRSAREADLPALIVASALERRCDRCVEAFDLFVEAYGAEAGNLALRTLATAGVYVGGGIAPKILPALKAGRFLEAFRAKAPLVDLLATIPVFVILNRRAGLLGAAVYAAQTAGGRSGSA
jgi:glucokinase